MTVTHQARSLLVTIGVGIAALAAPAVQAAPLLWTLDATFNESPATPTGPARVTGRFTYDPVTNTYADIMIDVRDLVLGGFAGRSLNAGNTTVFGSATAVNFRASRSTFNPTRPFESFLLSNGGLGLGFAEPLTAAGGIVALSRGTWLLEVDFIDPLNPNANTTLIDAQDLASGTVRATAVSVPVPEPSGLGLAVVTLGLLAATLGARATRPRGAVSRA